VVREAWFPDREVELRRLRFPLAEDLTTIEISPRLLPRAGGKLNGLACPYVDLPTIRLLRAENSYRSHVF